MPNEISMPRQGGATERKDREKKVKVQGDADVNGWLDEEEREREMDRVVVLISSSCLSCHVQTF